MSDLTSPPIAAPAPTRTNTLAYLAELLGEQAALAESIGEPFLAYLIGLAALQADQRVRRAWGVEVTGKG